jgi:hypothetical protein
MIRDIDQYDIVSDSGDVFPENHIVIFSSKQAQKAAWTRNNNCQYPTVDDLDQHIIHKTQPAPIADVNDFLAS